MPHLRRQEIGRTVVVAGDCADFDDFAGVATDWDLDFRQLDRGTGPVQLTQIGTDRIRLMGFRLERRYEQRGSSPPGVVTIGLPAKAGEPIRWRRSLAPPGSMICFTSGAEFAAVTRAGFTGTTLSIAVDHLTEIAEGLGLVGALAGTDVLQLLTGRNLQAVDRLRESVDSVLALTSMAR